MRMVARGGVVRRVPEKGVVGRRVFGRGNVEVVCEFISSVQLGWTTLV